MKTMPVIKSISSIKTTGFWLGILLFIITALFFQAPNNNSSISYMLATTLLMGIWWITEAVPLSITALIPVVFYPIFGIMNGKEVSTAYFNHIIFLFIGGFIVSLAMEKWNLHKRIALKILLSVGISPSKILLGFMLTTAFLSMWISNTATAMMMVPIALSVIDSLKGILNEKSFKKYSTALLLGIAYSASVGGIATLIGTPPNLAFSQIFSISFPEAPEISFVQWMMFGIPLSLTMFILIWLVLYIFYVPGNTFDNTVLNKLQKQYHKLGKITFEEKVVLASFILLSILWITRSPINIKLENGSIKFGGWSSIFPHPEYFNDGTVAIFIGIILFLIPSKQKKKEKIMDKTTMKKLPWDIILLFGGGFALAKGFVASGLSGWIIKSFSGLASVSPLIILIAIALGLSLLTEFTSNTATAQMALPLLAAISVSANINPLFLMIPATIATSLAFIMPVATPPNLIVFGTGKISIKEMAKTGIIIDLIGVAVVVLFMYLVIPHILNININQVPDWINSFSK